MEPQPEASAIIEHAKTARSKCRRCGEPIGKGELRFGDRVENPFGAGEATQWYHLACGAEKRPEKVAQALEAFPEELPERAALDEACRDGVENPKLATVRHAERSPSGRARCQHCRQIIEKGALRVAVEREDDLPVASASYLHAQCAKPVLGEARLWSKLQRVSRATLSPEDLALLRSELEQGAPGA